ncbi:MAG: hypothetical protein KA275_01955 [Chitinophagaceae bacterium]|nr:hypothetical protein [Chitinophagaceae bacterium]
MSVRKQIPYKFGSFFITITNASWLPLFELTNSYELVYKWFDVLKNQGHYINAFVIMPNHLHAIISFKNTEKPLNTIIGNGKRFMAYEIVNRLKELNLDECLYSMKEMVNKTDRENGKKHEVLEPSFDWKLLESEKFIEQKLNYIHTNPIRLINPLCESPNDYLHSSSLQYHQNNIENRYPIISIYEMQDISLSSG